MESIELLDYNGQAVHTDYIIIDEPSQKYIKKSANMALVISSSVFIGVIAILVYLGWVLKSLVAINIPVLFYSYMTTIVRVVLGIVFIFYINLFLYGIRANKAIAQNDSQEWVKATNNLKYFYKIQAITIIGLFILGICLVTYLYFKGR